jgi:hypothetical protein
MLRAMGFSRRWQLAGLLSLLIVACGSARHGQRPARVERARPTSQTSAPKPQVERLYAADEALRDALSGRLDYVGTGPWPGINRMFACAFRNQRVLVVNVYCSIMESEAFRIDVYSPTRGRVRIYAEAQGPVSPRTRAEYFTFTAESEPRPTPQARLPALALAMSFEQLRAYDELRYRAYLPACYGGQEASRQRSGCLGTLAPRAKEWADQNRSFLASANSDWYRVVRDLRALAMRHGRQPE